MRLAMPFRSYPHVQTIRAIVLISLSFPAARSGLGMLPQPYCASACAARTDCVSLGMGSQIDWMFPRRDIPRVSLRWSRVASSCPADSPKGQYEERLKPQLCRQSVARLHKPVYQGSEGLPPAGLRRLDRGCAAEACLAKSLWTMV